MRPQTSSASPGATEAACQSAGIILGSQAPISGDMAVINATEPLLAIGQLQGIEFVRRVADVAAAQVFTQIRNNNKFKDLPYRAVDGSVRHVANLDEFCDHFLGKSSRRMYELAANLSVLGSELYEQAERIGFRARDYQAFKALPADDQLIVKRAIESSADKGELLDLLSDLAQRNAALRAKNDEAVKAVATKDRVIKSKSATIDKLEEQLAARDQLPTSEQEKLQVEDLEVASVAAINALTKLVATADRVLGQPATESSELCARQSVDYVMQRLVDACLQRGITCDLADKVSPIWASSLEAAAAAREKPGARASNRATGQP